MTPEQEHDAFMGWMQEGIESKWVSFPTCTTHDVLEMTPDEESEWEVGYDPCIFGMRVWYGQ